MMDAYPFVCLDIDTTGKDPIIHEIYNIYAIPMSNTFEVSHQYTPFMTSIKPQALESTRFTGGKGPIRDAIRHGHEAFAAQELFVDWLKKFHRQIVVVSWAYREKMRFLHEWLGEDIYDEYFSPHYRDLQEYARFIGDRAHLRGENIPFTNLDVTEIAKYTGYTEYLIGGKAYNSNAYDRVRSYPVIYHRLLKERFL